MEKLKMKIKVLEFLQDIISRMADNSFKIKGWSIALTVSLYTLLIVMVRLDKLEGSHLLVLLPVVPIFILSVLDAYYLKLERGFRKKYNEVAKIKNDDFSEKNLELRPNNEKINICTVYFSKSILLFYISILFAPIILFFILK